MKTKLTIIKRSSLLLLLSTLNSQLSTHAQGTEFAYQGLLNDGPGPANGSYDFRFALFDASTAGTQQGNAITNAATSVSNGAFNVILDFGNQFPGADRYLETAVRTNGGGSFTTLSPRQKLTPTPYAITAGNIVSGGLAAGIYGNAVNLNNAANQFAGSYSGNGANVTNVNAATLNGLASAAFWKLAGNNGADPAVGAFLGTSDNLPLEIKVNGVRALRVEPNPNGAPNLIGGSPVNFVSGNVDGATIGGGGTTNAVGLPSTNSVTGSFGTVSGGVGNTAGNDATVGGGRSNSAGGGATVGGGGSNMASGDSATVSGGSGNTASGNYATVGGGIINTAANFEATVAGGEQNVAGGRWATVGGGDLNSANGDYATVPGGRVSAASGQYSLAAGRQAKANHQGAFVWADSAATDFASQRNDQFRVRASGGARFDVNSNQWVEVFTKSVGLIIPISKLIDTSTGAYLSSAGVWTDSSDRHRKTGFVPVDPQRILAEVTTLPVRCWSYTNEIGVRHIGPVAQDFHATFGVGADDKGIATLDEAGVALAAIQGLNEKVEVRSERAEGRIQKLEAENAELKARLTMLEKLIANLGSKGN